MTKITENFPASGRFIRKPPLVPDRGLTRGGFLIKQDFLNNNSTDGSQTGPDRLNLPISNVSGLFLEPKLQRTVADGPKTGPDRSIFRFRDIGAGPSQAETDENRFLDHPTQ